MLSLSIGNHASDLLMRSDLTFDPFFKVKQGSTIFKGSRTHLLLVLEALDVEFSNFPLSTFIFHKKNMGHLQNMSPNICLFH